MAGEKKKSVSFVTGNLYFSRYISPIGQITAVFSEPQDRLGLPVSRGVRKAVLKAVSKYLLAGTLYYSSGTSLLVTCFKVK